MSIGNYFGVFLARLGKTTTSRWRDTIVLSWSIFEHNTFRIQVGSLSLQWSFSTYSFSARITKEDGAETSWNTGTSWRWRCITVHNSLPLSIPPSHHISVKINSYTVIMLIVSITYKVASCIIWRQRYVHNLLARHILLVLTDRKEKPVPLT